MGLPPAAQASGTARPGERPARRRRFAAVEQHRVAGARGRAGHRRAGRRAGRGSVVLAPRVGPAGRAAPRLDDGLPRERAARGGVHPAALPLVRRGLGGPALQRHPRRRRRGHGLPAVHPVPLAPAGPGGTGRVRRRRGRLPDGRAVVRPGSHPGGAASARRHRRGRPAGRRGGVRPVDTSRITGASRALRSTGSFRMATRATGAQPRATGSFRGAQDTNRLGRPYYQAPDE